MRLAFAAAVVVLAAALPAAAQPSTKQRADATAAYQEGQRRYLDEDYAGAAAQFETAYKLDPDPAYEFNIAQAHRLAKHCEKALFWYRKFLVDAPKAPNAQTVKKYIADLEAECGTPAAAVPPRPEPEPLERPDAIPIDAPPRPKPSRWKRNAGFGALAVGVAGVITGAVFTAKTFGYASDREKLCPAPCAVWPDAREDELNRLGHRAEKLQWVGYGIGAAGLGAGAWLLLSYGRERRDYALSVVTLDTGAIVSLTFAR